MSIRAIYKDGVFKPIEDVPMKEGTEVEVYPREEKGDGKTRKSVFDLEFFGMWKNRDDIGTGDGGLDPPSPAPTDQALVAHDPRHPLPADAHTVVPERTMHTRPAIRAARLVKDVLDTFAEFLVEALTGRRNVLVPLVEGGPGDLEQLARLDDVAPLQLLRLDEREHAHRVSLAKKAVARLRMSRSSRNTRFSRRSSASSAS